jgi:sugar phosphate isomerase/epimerase
MTYTRRDVGRLALAAIPLAKAVATPNSRFNGVQIGVISYSFRPVTDVDEVIADILKVGINEVELMSNSVEASAGAPNAGLPAAARRGPATAPGGGAPARAPSGARRQITPEEQAAADARAAELRKWRLAASPDIFKAVRRKFDDAGIHLGLLCFNLRDNNTDDEIEYAFRMAQALGVKGITTSTTVSMSKRIAPLADKHKMLVGYHGHDQTGDPNEFATLESYAAAFSYSKYNGVNLDVGHFTASNYDAVAFIKEHHARITNLHIKDRKKDHGPNVPWGQGDTPLGDILHLLRANKYPFPANIELEYPIPEGSSSVAEVAKCVDYCKRVLA